jgi:hypothetical protein
MQSLVAPAVNEALLRASAPIPLRVEVKLDAGQPAVAVEPT